MSNAETPIMGAVRNAETPILEVRDLTKVFGDPNAGGTIASDRVSLALDERPPRILSIVG